MAVTGDETAAGELDVACPLRRVDVVGFVGVDMHTPAPSAPLRVVQDPKRRRERTAGPAWRPGSTNEEEDEGVLAKGVKVGTKAVAEGKPGARARAPRPRGGGTPSTVAATSDKSHRREPAAARGDMVVG